MPILDLIRYIVFAIFVLSAAVAFGSWAVTTRRVNPFSSAARFIRSTTDPILVPFERWLLQRGGNPQNAPWWLLGVAIVGGIIVITVTQWLGATLMRAGAAASQGPRGIIRLVVSYAGRLIIYALIARVIGSWFGLGRFNRWMRPAYRLTDWIVEPLRRIIPPFGRIDITPIVAWILLQVMLSIVMRMI